MSSAPLVLRGNSTSRPAWPRSQHGFTLIEILVVIVIIAVIVATATVAVSVLGSDRELEQEAKRFAAVLNQAREEGELQGLDIGIFIAQPAYTYLRYDGRSEQWKPIEGDELYKTRELPEGVRARLWLDGREVVLKPQLEPFDEHKPDKHAPQIFALSSGEISPFELRLERDGTTTQWRVIGSADNTITVEATDDSTR
jgi:general secretion pathway protein H